MSIDAVLNNEPERQYLLEFARRLTREVCVRAASHAPATPDERRQATQGTVHPRDLDCIKEITENIIGGL